MTQVDRIKTFTHYSLQHSTADRAGRNAVYNLDCSAPNHIHSTCSLPITAPSSHPANSPQEQYRRAKQELEERRRNKKVKIEEITSFISGEVIDLTED